MPISRVSWARSVSGHENMQKTVLCLVDGLLIHPVIGKKKKGDFRDEVILKCYDALIENYFPKRESGFGGTTQIKDYLQKLTDVLLSS